MSTLSPWKLRVKWSQLAGTNGLKWLIPRLESAKVVSKRKVARTGIAHEGRIGKSRTFHDEARCGLGKVPARLSWVALPVGAIAIADRTIRHKHLVWPKMATALMIRRCQR